MAKALGGSIVIKSAKSKRSKLQPKLWRLRQSITSPYR